jgi:hypothetical protein
MAIKQQRRLKVICELDTEFLTDEEYEQWQSKIINLISLEKALELITPIKDVDWYADVFEGQPIETIEEIIQGAIVDLVL